MSSETRTMSAALMLAAACVWFTPVRADPIDDAFRSGYEAGYQQGYQDGSNPGTQFGSSPSGGATIIVPGTTASEILELLQEQAAERENPGREMQGMQPPPQRQDESGQGMQMERMQ